ncbi:MAG: SulP family inorganic anion transporter [Bacteroidota bacterium]
MMMRNFQFTKGDFFGGLTAGIVALPLALAFGVQSGLGAAAGLYGAIFLGFFAALLGGTPSQISGPTGPMTVVTTTTVAAFIAVTGSLTDATIGALVVCFALAGIFQIIMGFAKIGTLIKYIPYPVISGFMSGIGVIIILLQLFPAIGQASPKTTVDVVQTIVPAFSNINTWALIYCALTIVIIYLFPKITKAVPSTLIALLAVTILSVILGNTVPVIGDIPQGFPPLRIGDIMSVPSEFYVTILEAALTLAALGAIDSLLTSVVADNVTKTRHDSNKELVGQGVGNAVTGLFAGIPGAGATMRTLVNIRSGGRNRVSGVIHAVVLLIILLGAGKYAALIPKAVLAGILITVGIGILDYKGFKHMSKVPRADAVIMIIVLIITVFLDLLVAVGIGMFLAAILFMKKMGDIAEEKNKTTDIYSALNETEWSDENMPVWMKDNVVVKHLDGPLFFGFASAFQQRVNQLSNIQYVIIRMEKVPFIDQTGLYALEESILSLEQKGIDVLLTGLQEQPKDMLRKIKLIPDLISDEHMFKTFNDCVTWLKYKVVD